MTTPLVSLDDVKGLLPIREGNSTFDNKIAMMIRIASGQIETAIERELTYMERIQFFRTPYTRTTSYDFLDTMNESGVTSRSRRVRYALKALPVDRAAPFTVYYDPYRNFGPDTIVDPRFYTVDYDMGLFMIQLDMVDALDSLKVVYSAGFAPGVTGDLSDAITDDFKMACISQAISLFQRATPDNVGKDTDSTQKNTGGGRFANKAGIVPEAIALISRYRALAVGLY
jgi:hypothetical protein